MTTSQPAATEKYEREAFEAWFESAETRFDDDTPCSVSAWAAWQARASYVAPAQPQRLKQEAREITEWLVGPNFKFVEDALYARLAALAVPSSGKWMHDLLQQLASRLNLAAGDDLTKKILPAIDALYAAPVASTEAVVEALRFYADPKSYESYEGVRGLMSPPVYYDCGHQAKQALSVLPAPPTMPDAMGET